MYLVPRDHFFYSLCILLCQIYLYLYSAGYDMAPFMRYKPAKRSIVLRKQQIMTVGSNSTIHNQFEVAEICNILYWVRAFYLTR